MPFSGSSSCKSRHNWGHSATGDILWPRSLDKDSTAAWTDEFGESNRSRTSTRTFKGLSTTKFNDFSGLEGMKIHLHLIRHSYSGCQCQWGVKNYKKRTATPFHLCTRRSAPIWRLHCGWHCCTDSTSTRQRPIRLSIMLCIQMSSVATASLTMTWLEHDASTVPRSIYHLL